MKFLVGNDASSDIVSLTLKGKGVDDGGWGCVSKVVDLPGKSGKESNQESKSRNERSHQFRVRKVGVRKVGS